MTQPRWLDFAAKAAQSVWRLSREDGSPYLDRVVLHGVDSLENHDPANTWSAFIHEIHGSDGDRHMHDHPWAWAVAIVLSGGYGEKRGRRAGGTFLQSFAPGDLNVLYPGEYHSIVAVEPNTKTLFLCGREVSDWGFLVDGRHVPHAEYFDTVPDVQRMTHARIA